MAVDQDGPSAISQIAELSSRNPLPKTVAFASGRAGRCQYLFLVPERYRDSLKTKKIKTGVIGDDGKGEQLEFRWKNLQSVLPPSVHPTTGSYHWVEGCAIDETEIAIAPDWIIQQMLVEGVGNSESGVGRFTPPSTYESPLPRSDIDYAPFLPRCPSHLFEPMITTNGSQLAWHCTALMIPCLMSGTGGRINRLNTNLEIVTKNGVPFLQVVG